MSKFNGLHRLYDQLESEERFRLDVLAIARGDADESEYLSENCLRRSYTMNDWGFVGRWAAARELSLLTYMEVFRSLDKIQVLEAFQGVFEGFDKGEELEDMERGMVAAGLAHWAAFSDLCVEELGVEAVKVLAAVTPQAAEKARTFENLAARLGAEPDPAAVREYRETMLGLWRRVLAKG